MLQKCNTNATLDITTKHQQKTGAFCFYRKGGETMRELLTAKEVCRWLRITRPTLDKMRKRGEVKSIKVGGTIRFLKEDIESFLNTSKN